MGYAFLSFLKQLTYHDEHDLIEYKYQYVNVLRGPIRFDGTGNFTGDFYYIGEKSPNRAPRRDPGRETNGGAVPSMEYPDRSGRNA
jgi:hypothetical protein